MSSIVSSDGAIVKPASSWHLPAGFISSYITLRDGIIRTHFLSAGNSSNPLILLLHGFPELSYSWRDVILPLSLSPSVPGRSRYRVVAPDLRGHGLTRLLTRPDPAAPVAYDEDISAYRIEEVVEDVVALVHALGKTKVHMLVGHDFGSAVAANCALTHPELFERLVLSSAPYAGPPPQTPERLEQSKKFIKLLKDGLAGLDPPRKHYMVYFSGREASHDILAGEEGGEGESHSLHDFMRAYLHVKSADWDLQPKPHHISMPSPAEANGSNPLEALSELPEYYIMRSGLTMPQTVIPHLPLIVKDSEHWMSESALAVYVDTYRHTGFQGPPQSLSRHHITLSPFKS